MIIYKVYTFKSLIKTVLDRFYFEINPPKPEEIFEEVCQFTGKSIDYAVKQATINREFFAQNFKSKKRNSELEIRSAYSEVDTWLYSQVWYNRKQSWYFVSDKIPRNGCLCEYGCGMAVLSNWLLKKRRDIQITITDIPSSTWEFCKWKYSQNKRVKLTEVGLGKEGLPLKKDFDVITCFDVLEHTVNPLEIVSHFIDHLKDMGYLMLDFQKDERAHGSNLREAQKQREETINLLKNSLKMIKPIHVGIGIYQK